MLRLLWGGPVLLIFISFFFGVGLQVLGLIGSAKSGGVLSGFGGAAMTVLMAAFFCIPGYLVAILWFGIKTKHVTNDMHFLKKKIMLIPLISLVTFWIPAVLIPHYGIGVRLQVAGLTVFLMMIFGYLWIAIVRLAIKLFARFNFI